MELSRLLRRGLLVAAIAAAGWLLSAVFAGSASADELPEDHARPQPQSSAGLLGGLLGGITHTVTGLTDTVAELTGSVAELTGSVVGPTTTLLTPVAPEAPEPVVDAPVLLPGDGWSGGWSGSNETVRVDPPPVPEPVAPAPAPQPVARPVAPAPQPVTPASLPEPVTPASEPVSPAPVVVAQAAPQEHADADSGHRAGTGSAPEPVKTPAGPSAPGSTASAAHDNTGGARGTQGVPVSHAPLTHPADAGFTTRSRAVDAAGRDAGLPISTPD